MFHQPTSVDYFTGEEVREPAFEREMASREFVRRYFVRSEMDPVWRDKMVDEWRRGNVWKTGRDLLREGSNIVTELD